MNPYRGITYPLPCWDWLLLVWKRVMCPHHWHLFDESWTVRMDDPKDNHVLVCDACGFIVQIAGFNEKEGKG